MVTTGDPKGTGWLLRAGGLHWGERKQAVFWCSSVYNFFSTFQEDFHQLKWGGLFSPLKATFENLGEITCFCLFYCLSVSLKCPQIWMSLAVFSAVIPLPPLLYKIPINVMVKCTGRGSISTMKRFHSLNEPVSLSCDLLLCISPFFPSPC